MRAIVITESGGPEALQLVETPAPEPGPGQILVRVSAAAVNPVDLQTAAGMFHELGWINQPDTTGIGWDVAGTVARLGPGVAGPAVGTAVAALLDTLDVPLGGYAEAVLVPAPAVAALPPGLDPVAAATVPLNALTADQALDLLDLPAGARLLVTGAAGAVGGYALSLAARRGLAVTGLARVSDEKFVSDAGAIPVSSLPTEPTYDAVLDAAALVGPALAAVLDGGRYVGVLPYAVPEPVRGIVTAAVKVHHDGTRLAELLAAAAAGTLPVRVAQALPLTEAAEAHRLAAAGGVRGRYVLRP